MARHGLVHRQGGQFIQGPLVQLAGVDDVAARDAHRHRTGVVAAGGVGLLHLDRDRTHAVRQARQGREQGRQAVVRAFGDLRRLLQQFLARLGVELRVSAQEVQEAGEVAGPTRGAHLSLHAGADAGDFLNADLVHLIGRQVGGRIAAYQEGVDVSAAGAVDQTRLLRSLGRIFVAQQVAPGGAAGGDRSLDQGAGAGAELVLLRGGDGGGQGVERAQQDVARLARRQVALGLGQGAVDDRTGLDQAGLQPASGVGDPGVVIGGRCFKTLQPGLGIGGRGDARSGGQIGHELAGAAFGIEGQTVQIQFDLFQLAADQIADEGVVQAVGFVQRGRVDGVQPRL
ncbi:hypothetical protein ACMZ4W_02316 [Brevundimonas naejangsanensis]